MCGFPVGFVSAMHDLGTYLVTVLESIARATSVLFCLFAVINQNLTGWDTIVPGVGTTAVRGPFETLALRPCDRKHLIKSCCVMNKHLLMMYMVPPSVHLRIPHRTLRAFSRARTPLSLASLWPPDIGANSEPWLKASRKQSDARSSHGYRRGNLRGCIYPQGPSRNLIRVFSAAFVLGFCSSGCYTRPITDVSD